MGQYVHQPSVGRLLDYLKGGGRQYRKSERIWVHTSLPMQMTAVHSTLKEATVDVMMVLVLIVLMCDLQESGFSLGCTHSSRNNCTGLVKPHRDNDIILDCNSIVFSEGEAGRGDVAPPRNAVVVHNIPE